MSVCDKGKPEYIKAIKVRSDKIVILKDGKLTYKLEQVISSYVKIKLYLFNNHVSKTMWYWEKL